MIYILVLFIILWRRFDLNEHNFIALIESVTIEFDKEWFLFITHMYKL